MENRGYKEFDSKLSQVKNRLEEISDLIDINEYKKQINEVVSGYKKENENHNTNFARINLPNMQKEYDAYSYDEFIDELERIASKAESEVEDFKNVKDLNKRISSLLDQDDIDIDKLTNAAIELIRAIGLINFYNTKAQKNIIEKAYKNIFTCLQIESILGKDIILNFFKRTNNKADIIGVEKLIYKQIDYDKMSIKEIVDSELANHYDNRVGNGYLNSVLLKTIAKSNYPKLYKQYYETKKEDIKKLNDKIKKHNTYLKELEDQFNAHGEEYRIIEKKMVEENQFIRILFVAIPLALTIIGSSIGLVVNSNKKEINVDAYDLTSQKITKSYRDGLVSKKDIDESYNPTIIEYSPWQETEEGYIRTVTQYIYEKPIEYDKIYDLTVDDIKNNLKRVRSYNQEKSYLNIDEDENTSHIVVEYKSIGKVSFDSKVEGAFVGFGCALILYLILLGAVVSIQFGPSSYSKPREEKKIEINSPVELIDIIYRLKEEIKIGKSLLKEREYFKNTHGILEDELIYPELGDDEIIKKI